MNASPLAWSLPKLDLQNCIHHSREESHSVGEEVGLLHPALVESLGLVAELAVVDNIDSTLHNFDSHHMQHTDLDHRSIERIVHYNLSPRYPGCSHLADLMYLAGQQAL